MATAVFQSAQSRPLALRRRGDVVVQRLSLGGRPFWNLKDPVSLRYFQLRDEEYALWQMLDGQTSLDQMHEQFERQFAPQKLALPELQGFLGMLHESGLIVGDASGQAEPLLQRHRKFRRRQLWETFASPLAIRFRGFDPQRFFDWLNWRFGWLFAPASAWAGVALVLLTVFWVAARWSEVTTRLPEFADFFTLRDAPWFLLAIALTKVLHELGHGLACRRHGGECHELGLMLLCFAPCLYCNVSDAWMFPSRWRRVAVGAAGMFVELVLAAASFWVWWWSSPGLLNSLALKIAFVSSVGTVILNANPLLRYDGYFILGDLLDTPNLQQQSAGVWLAAIGRWVLGTELVNERSLPERGRGWFALYAVLSLVYRWAVVLGLLWFFYRAALPYRAEVLVAMLGLVVVGAMIVVPAVQAGRMLGSPSRRREIHWRRTLFWLVGLLGLLAALLLVKLPNSISASAVISPAGAKRVYVTSPGRLASSVAAGQAVKAGDELARLENRQLELEIARLRQQRDLQQLHRSNLQRQRIGNPSAELQLPGVTASLADLEEQLRQRQADAERLTLRAPQDGTVLAPNQAPPRDTPGELRTWNGTPLDPQNLGSFLPIGTLVCLVGDPQQLEANLLLDQADLEFVHEQQIVRLRLEQFPEVAVSGKIAEIARADLAALPRSWADRPDVASKRDESGVARPASATYQVRVELDPVEFALVSGATGRGKIDADWQPLGRRLLRFLASTFDFRR